METSTLSKQSIPPHIGGMAHILHITVAATGKQISPLRVQPITINRHSKTHTSLKAYPYSPDGFAGVTVLALTPLYVPSTYPAVVQYSSTTMDTKRVPKDMLHERCGGVHREN